ncbi:hypothetical protein AQ490_10045 [Wenjunlia vitaminophila]|uniref:Pyridoxamine 5'-phosphate oxidase putative domain-containing protein n=1 Tax=Wenjunlia vitaminophila TaxID=76728 RepID=A0A0T6LMK0_WENVI|nr:hypothetical protein [Wenjunlia vitaminophila]KRV47084.1 hypothetical protein AQ490_10045 [Wenjunlia vitaminophila]
MTLLDQALVEESAKKSALIWITVPDGTARPLWHVWHDGAVHVVGDGAEQPLHGLADGATALVTARSKDKGGRLVRWPARVRELAAGSAPWRAAAEELKGKRLNAPDAEGLPERWAATGARVLRLELAGAPDQAPGTLPDTSGAAAPLPSPAVTRRPIPAALPRLLTRRGRRG